MAQQSHYIGFGYSKDILGQKAKLNTSNQFTVLGEKYYQRFVIGGSLRYYNMFQDDERRLIYFQLLSSLGIHRDIHNASFGIYFQNGIWEREKSISAIEDDFVNNNLLHLEAGESDRKGNLYFTTGTKFQMAYKFETKQLIVVAPTAFLELHKNVNIFRHNEFLSGSEKMYAILVGGALCIGF